MKWFILYFSFLVVTCTATKNLHKFANKPNKRVSKRDSSIDECKIINSLLGQNESFNCCEYDGIYCEQGHIIAM